MERLTGRHYKNKIAYYKHCIEADCNSSCFDCSFMDTAVEKLATYEDLEEQGLLLKLPCKKGDIVYDLVLCDDKKWHVFEMKVCAINPFGDTRNGKTWNVYLECTTEASKSYRSFYDFGITVFFSQEEAENGKKKMEKEGE